MPRVFVRRFGNRTGDSPGVVVFVKVTQECSIADIQIAFLLEPAAQADNRPIMSISAAWVIHHRKDGLAHFLGRKGPGPSGFGSIGDAIDTGVIETLDPELEATLGDARVLSGQFKGSATKEKMDSVQPFLRLPIGAAIAGQPQLIKRAVIRIRKFA